MQWYLIVAGIVVIKVALNLAKSGYLKVQFSNYMGWLDGTEKSYGDLLKCKSRTIGLMKSAGISDKGAYSAEPAGYGYSAGVFIGMYSQHPSKAVVLAKGMHDGLLEAIGRYRGQAIDAINPLYWVGLIVYLPTRALVSVGAKPEGILLKGLQGLYWLAGVILTAIFMLWKPLAQQWLTQILKALGP